MSSNGDQIAAKQSAAAVVGSETAGGEAGQPSPAMSADGTLRLKAGMLDAIAILHEMDAAGRITTASPALCKLTGYTAEEIIAGGHRLLTAGAGDEEWLARHVVDPKTEMRSGDSLVLRKDGSDLWLSSVIAEVRDHSGALTGYMAASVDVTESRKLREEFLRSGKLMQLGQLTATVAHEIRNPMGAIRTANFVLQRKLDGSREGVELQLERINKAIARCDKIITELLDFSKQKTMCRSELAVDEWVASILDEETSNLLGSPVVERSFGLPGGMAAFDADQMRQVVVNLLSNAAEALSEKVKTQSDADFVPRISVSTSLVGDLVQIAVSDNGPGIEAKNMKRVREPLFTTKSFGVGLGIPAIMKILESHLGRLDIESVPGQGATMKALFPRAGRI